MGQLVPLYSPESSWEVGGNCNFLIAASRIGGAVYELNPFDP
jgi:hypothetical protein